MPAEYMRLLGYPRGWMLEGRARELADLAADWYAKQRPAVGLLRGRRKACRSLTDRFKSTASHSPVRGCKALCNARKRTARCWSRWARVPSWKQESQRRWQDEKPDEYFFLEMFGSAVVERLITITGARLCAWAEEQRNGRAAALQSGLSGVGHRRAIAPARADDASAGGCRCLRLWKCSNRGHCARRKSLLAVFGLTRHTERVRPLTGLVAVRKLLLRSMPIPARAVCGPRSSGSRSRVRCH